MTAHRIKAKIYLSTVTTYDLLATTTYLHIGKPASQFSVTNYYAAIVSLDLLLIENNFVFEKVAQ